MVRVVLQRSTFYGVYIRYVRTHHRASTSLGVHFLYSRGFSTTFFTSRVNYGTSYHATTSSRRVYPSSLYSRSLLPFPPCRYTGGLVFQSILPLGFLFLRYHRSPRPPLSSGCGIVPCDLVFSRLCAIASRYGGPMGRCVRDLAFPSVYFLRTSSNDCCKVISSRLGFRVVSPREGPFGRSPKCKDFRLLRLVRFKSFCGFQTSGSLIYSFYLDGNVRVVHVFRRE